MFSSGFNQLFITDTNPQLTIPIASDKGTSGLINSKETVMKLLIYGNDKEEAIKLFTRNFLIYQYKSSKKMVKI